MKTARARDRNRLGWRHWSVAAVAGAGAGAAGIASCLLDRVSVSAAMSAAGVEVLDREGDDKVAAVEDAIANAMELSMNINARIYVYHFESRFNICTIGVLRRLHCFFQAEILVYLFGILPRTTMVPC